MTPNRKPAYENEACRAVGLMASCNSCDRIIWEDENDMPNFVASGGYCRECRGDQWKEIVATHVDRLLTNINSLLNRKEI